MHWVEFVLATDETAVYPDTGLKTPAEFSYICLGLCGEIGEMVSAASQKEKLKEAGDVFWYLARGYKALNGFYRPPVDNEERELYLSDLEEKCAVSALLIGNTSKKLLRDGMTEDLLEDLRKQFSQMFSLLKQYTEGYGLSLETVLNQVMEKLRSRKERGVLGGGGNER